MKSNIDIIKDFSRLQAHNRELGKTNVMLVGQVMELKKKLEAFERIDELLAIMRPRYHNTISMDGNHKNWTVWMTHTGTVGRSSLKEAILEYYHFLLDNHPEEIL